MNKIRYDLPSAGAEFRYVSLVLFQMIDSGSLNLEALDISFHIFVETSHISGIGGDGLAGIRRLFLAEQGIS